MADTASAPSKKTEETVTSLKDVVHPADMPARRVEDQEVKTASGTTAAGTKISGPAELINRLKK